ncbi:hypothetical protein DOM22_04885 [Bdellovibrio sp. ZAP7]|uniref:hypothetical protein n=1 Tax=Bdellovibrio sp. ZAP7 TaxID=2231053 RepID=UPI0011584A7F|nr:hypothetical protein [Bdellovibrio sp. ZAP7]QDK44539.1 hypothetical protein DOM22_04885 [Bdellovibrio sp. ZAP7]
MRFLFVVFAFLLNSLVANAQVSIIDQSPSSTQWKTIENDFVKVIYPETFKSRAIYVANMIEHYSQVVGLSYGIKTPKKVTLIIRDQMAEPNGFVTLMPRRTEWYGSTTFSPIVGSTEWYQTLSIHEYRHVQQFDAFSHNTVDYFNWLFGDLGIALADSLVNKSWMKEGDAVYAETKFTDAGRGRSPRFLARLKALLMGRATPTYDQFISGTYQDSLVNQYVYGYILISRAYQKYGDDFWEKINEKNSRGPHPWRFENAFKDISGTSFRKFYYESFDELRKQWAKDSFPGLEKTEFSVATDPKFQDGATYFIQYDLNKVPALYKKTANETEKVVEIPYTGDLGRLDYSADHAVYSDFLPHPRYGFQGYSDLVLVNLKSGSHKYMTSDLRVYNPHFGHDGKTVLATEYLQDQTWQIVEFDLTGKRLRSLKLANLNLVEAVALDKDKVVVFALDKAGYRSMIQASFGSDKFTTILPGSRNNMFSLHSNGNGDVLFEAQYKGVIEILKLNSATMTFSQCTQSKIASYSPTFAGSEFYYSEQFPYGNRIQKGSLNDCKPIAKTELVDSKYLGDDPSDAYNKFPEVKIADQLNYDTKNASKYHEEDYSGFDARAFTPHTWSFFASRGFGLTVMTDNYLRDFGATVSLGSDGEENVPYTSLQVDFKRYWPVLSLLGDIRNRKTNVMNSDPEQDLTWREGSYGVGMLLPYQFKHHMYSGFMGLGYSAKILRTESYRVDDVGVPGTGSSQYVDQTVNFQFSYAKEAQTRAILSPWSITLLAEYEDASTMNEDSVPGSYRTYGSLALTTPGIFRNNSILLAFSGQQGEEGTGHYLFAPPVINPVGYVYSRGFDYKTSDKFAKASFNYMFPIAYPDWNAGLWIYVNRIYANLFLDNTKYTAEGIDHNLKSSGAELILQSKLFRVLPLSWGVRYIHKADPDQDDVELYVGTQLTLF